MFSGYKKNSLIGKKISQCSSLQNEQLMITGCYQSDTTPKKEAPVDSGNK